MKREVFTERAPRPVGAYSQAVAAGGFVFVSGQLGLDPKTGEMPEGVGEQARLALENLRAILEEAGSGLDRVVKVTVYLTDINDFAEVNRVYGEFFPKPYPARAAVAVRDLPKGAKVEIEAIALLGG